MPDLNHIKDYETAPTREIDNWNLDKGVTPWTKVMGVMSKPSASWLYWDQSVSAVQGAANVMRISAFSNDASTFRVSAFGVNIADITNTDAADLRVSAFVDSGSISARSNDASQLRISAFGYLSATLDNGSVSAKSNDASQVRVSAFSNDASTFRVSALGVNISDVTNQDAADFRVSAFIDSGSVSARSNDAAQIRVSAFSDAANLLRISAFQGDAANLRVSALDEFSFSNLAISGTSTIKSSSGTLHTITINTLGTGSTLKVYDNTAASGTLIATINTALSIITFIYNAKFATGLTVSATGTPAADLTVTYR